MWASLGETSGAEHRCSGIAWRWNVGRRTTEPPPWARFVSSRLTVRRSELGASRMKMTLFYKVPLQEAYMPETLPTWNCQPFLSLNWFHEIFFSFALAKQKVLLRMAVWTEKARNWMDGGTRVDGVLEEDPSEVPLSSSPGRVVGAQGLAWPPSSEHGQQLYLPPLAMLLFLGQSWHGQEEHFRWKINNNC